MSKTLIKYESKFDKIKLNLEPLKKINIFLGENMIGKSTALDMLEELMEIADFYAQKDNLMATSYLFHWRSKKKSGNFLELEEYVKNNFTNISAPKIKTKSNILKESLDSIVNSINLSLYRGKKISIDRRKSLVNNWKMSFNKKKEQSFKLDDDNSNGTFYFDFICFEKKFSVYSIDHLKCVFRLCIYHYLFRADIYERRSISARRKKIINSILLGPNRITDDELKKTITKYRISSKGQNLDRKNRDLRNRNLGMIEVKEHGNRRNIGFGSKNSDTLYEFNDLSSGYKSISLMELAVKTDVNYLLIDEPEAHLSTKNITKLAKKVFECSRKNTTNFFFATHSEDFVRQIYSLAQDKVELYSLRKNKTGWVEAFKGTKEADEYFEQSNRNFIF